ncbi:Plp1p Ecym_4182 [Eremothecium cymbalariae DBVPG|uniref:Phosducin domain-containing protein n=1 Tax=Eremothecium cymbalariae (strain CBS 270.75 / DBVPG 7215 / KCTC 17166 / NRRL Y-17582) TaxID=931890 RepID=G8JTA5_ERECY|nr:hypothetical protein Ecym_4182 [Eremothecium cymbalariae DBVPG\
MADYDFKLANDTASSDSIDEVISALEDDDAFIFRYREQRIEEISRHLKEVKKNASEGEYGYVHTVESESELMQMTSKLNRVVIHFFLETFRRCSVMDDKLRELAAKHMTTKFLRISVDKCPFLVQKLNIKILPCVLSYVNAIERDRIIGFQQLGNQPDNFPLYTLEERLKKYDVIPSISETNYKNATRGDVNGLRSDSHHYRDEPDSDLDL